MSIASEATEPRRGPGIVVALVVVAVVCGWDLLAGVLPGYAARDNHPLSRGVVDVLVLSSFGAYAAGLLVVGRGVVRRLLAVLPVLMAAVLQGALLATEWAAFERESVDAVSMIDDVETVVGYAVPLLLVAAWGVARRGGALWVLGLVVTGLGTFLARRYDDDYLSFMLRSVGGVEGPYVGFDVTLIDVGWWLWWVLPILAGGVVGWLVDAASPHAGRPLPLARTEEKDTDPTERAQPGR